jgi:hypothetical protein
MAHGPLSGLAGRAFAHGPDFALSLAAKDVSLALGECDLAVSRAVHETLTGFFPNAADDDLGQIVHYLRTARRVTGIADSSEPFPLGVSGRG